MNLSEHIERGIFMLALSTALIGGHMVGSYLLLEPHYKMFDFYAYTTLTLLITNATVFGLAVVSFASNLTDKRKIMNAAFFLLLNIPVAFLYILILLNYET